MRAQDILQAAREWADEPESFQFALYSRMAREVVVVCCTGLGPT
jgi:hypothetical protein